MKTNKNKVYKKVKRWTVYIPMIPRASKAILIGTTVSLGHEYAGLYFSQRTIFQVLGFFNKPEIFRP